MLRIIKVTGSSLFPKIKPGDFVLIDRLPWLFHRVKTGDVVVFNHPIYGRMIKIVERVDRQRKELWVYGVKEESLDSKALGAVLSNWLIGKVIWHIKGE